MRLVAPWKREDAVADDRLDEEQRHVLGTQRSLEHVQVAEWDQRQPGQQRLEAVREPRVAGGGQRTQRQPVEAALDGDDPRAACCGSPNLDRSLDRLRTRARTARAPARGDSPQQLVREDRTERVDCRARASPECSSSSASWSAALTRGLLRPTLYIPKPPSQSRIAVAVGVEEMRTLGA